MRDIIKEEHFAAFMEAIGRVFKFAGQDFIPLGSGEDMKVLERLARSLEEMYAKSQMETLKVVLELACQEYYLIAKGRFFLTPDYQFH